MMLSEKTFFEFAVKSYQNPRCISVSEFKEDLARIKYVKRLLNRYAKCKDLQERLILNHLISIYNVFDYACAHQMLFFKCEKKTHGVLKAFLSFLNYLPDDQKNGMNEKVLKLLEEI